MVPLWHGQEIVPQRRSTPAAVLTGATKPAASLSTRQSAILRRLLAHEQIAASEALTPHCMAVIDLRGPGPKSAADSAAFSRAIRLARRGLIILCNFVRAATGLSNPSGRLPQNSPTFAIATENQQAVVQPTVDVLNRFMQVPLPVPTQH